jgi:hypothetical protein
MRLNTYVFRQSRKGRNREQEKAKLLYFPTRDIRQAESRYMHQVHWIVGPGDMQMSGS